MTRAATPFKGNKRYLPAKPCATCGRPMTWRKRWAKNWDEVKYCSDACRRHVWPVERHPQEPSRTWLRATPAGRRRAHGTLRKVRAR
jgi:hypothetical protein